MNTSGVKFCGQSSLELEEITKARSELRISNGDYKREHVNYIAKVSLSLLEKSKSLSDIKLEKLRRCCQLWEVDFRHQEITSHRKYIGPVIVAIKRAALPVLKILLKDIIHQQRDFNASVVKMLAELSAEDKKPA